jgi:hypothetical protein
MTSGHKELLCSCGNSMTTDGEKVICTRCGRYAFATAQARRAHRLHTIYVTVVIVMALGGVAYFFVELVLTPFFPR